MIWLLSAFVLGVYVVNRRRLMTLSVLGVYSTAFLVMNFVGVHFLLLGGKLPFGDFVLTQAARERAVEIADVGILCVWLGAALSAVAARSVGEPASVRRQRAKRWTLSGMVPRDDDGRVRVGIAPELLPPLALGLIGVFVGLYHSYVVQSVKAILAFNPVVAQGYRLSTGQQQPYILTTVAFNALPYAALAMLTVSWVNGRFRRFSWFVYAFAVLGLVYNTQKEPVVIFLVMTMVTRQVLAPWRIAKGRRGVKLARQLRRASRRVTLLRWLRIPAAGFVLLFALYYSTEGAAFSQNHSTSLTHTLNVSVSRLFLRTAQGYALVAQLVPSEIPHTGMHNITTLQKVVGGSVVNVDKQVFDRAFGASYGGTISSDSITNDYAEFGFGGVVLMGLLQGFLLASVDRFIARRNSIGIAVVFALFAMRFSIYLNETHIFGAFLGFGGLVAIILASVLNVKGTTTAPSRHSSPPRSAAVPA